MDRRPIAKIANAELFDAIKVGAPQVIVAALFHFIDTGSPPVDRRVAAFNARREEKGRSDCHRCSSDCGPYRAEKSREARLLSRFFPDRSAPKRRLPALRRARRAGSS